MANEKDTATLSILDISDEILQLIFLSANPADTAAIALTCQRFNALMNAGLPEPRLQFEDIKKRAMLAAKAVPKWLNDKIELYLFDVFWWILDFFDGNRLTFADYAALQLSISMLEKLTGSDSKQLGVILRHLLKKCKQEGQQGAAQQDVMGEQTVGPVPATLRQRAPGSDQALRAGLWTDVSAGSDESSVVGHSPTPSSSE